MNIKDMCKEAHAIATDKGFWDEGRNQGELIALIHSELSEALEALRKDKLCRFKGDILKFSKEKFEKEVKNTFEDEIADTFIRLGDLCGAMQIDIEAHIKAKMEYNKTRPRKHGKKF